MAEDIPFDVCVVGTGAGGGILADKLTRAGLRVISLEAGSELSADFFKTDMPSGAAKDFGIGPDSTWPSNPHDSLFIHPLFANGTDGSTSRPEGGFQHFQVLSVNGLQNLWNGVSVRFARQDFKGWPFGYDELDRHYGEVEQRITVCGTREGLDDLPDGNFVAPKPLRPADQLIVDSVDALREPHSRAIPNRKAIETRKGLAHSCISNGMCTSGCPVGSVYKFSARLLPALRKLSNYTLQTNAKVVRLLRKPGGRQIDGVEYIDTTTQMRHVLRARRYVLAAGAIETPRILFNSEDAENPAGLCNSTGRVGMGLQDNPKAVLSTSLWRLWNRRRDYDIGYGDLLILMSQGRMPDGTPFPFIGHAIHGIPDVPHYLGGMTAFPVFMRERLARMMFHSYVTLGLFCAGEATPHNRVRPGTTIDRHGVRQVAVDFEVPAVAHHQMQAMMDWGHKVLRKASATLIYTSRDNSGTGIHYAGTTAISDDPASGVVDGDLRAHGLDNLYICDGGVLPTLPDKHLTLTIMALANRLGEHLAMRAQANASSVPSGRV